MDKNKKGISEIPIADRPYEKALLLGVESLCDSELLAIILRSGVRGKSVIELSRDILYPESTTESITNLHHWTMDKLMEINGIGRVKALQIQCISQLAIRLAQADAIKGIKLGDANSIALYYKEKMRHLEHEEVHMLLLDSKAHLMAESCVSKGTVNASIIEPRELYIEALEKRAVGVILLHNHPSGDPTPSKEDLSFTNRVKKTGEIIGIPLLDHIVIGNNTYISMKEYGLL